MVDEKGELILQGFVKTDKLNDLSRQKSEIIIEFILIMSLVLFNFYYIFHNPNMYILFVFLFIIIVATADLFSTPLSIHGIYKNGISSCHHNLIDHFKNKTFQPYKDIKKIGFGKSIKEQKEFKFIVVYTDDFTKPAAIFNGFWIIGDFLDKLEEALKQNYPNVPWVELKSEDIPGWK